MKPAFSCALTGALLLLGANTAAALTVEDQDRLLTLLYEGADTTDGIEVGSATVSAPGASLIKGEKACEFDRILNAQMSCVAKAILFPPEGSGVDSIYYYDTSDIGHVDMEEWADGVNSEINTIWESYVKGSQEQAKLLGEEVTPLRWVLYPTLDKKRAVLTYGVLISFSGEKTINLMAVKFTRKGFAVMRLITTEELLASAGADFTSITDYASQTYAPATGFRYADFQAGDHVAEIGAVGVLATVMGVKYADKGVIGGILAALLIFAKKAWFLVLAIPVVIWAGLKRLFGRGT